MDELSGLWLSDFHTRTLYHLDTAMKAVDQRRYTPKKSSLSGGHQLHTTFNIGRFIAEILPPRPGVLMLHMHIHH